MPRCGRKHCGPSTKRCTAAITPGMRHISPASQLSRRCCPFSLRNRWHRAQIRATAVRMHASARTSSHSSHRQNISSGKTHEQSVSACAQGEHERRSLRELTHVYVPGYHSESQLRPQRNVQREKSGMPLDQELCTQRVRSAVSELRHANGMSHIHMSRCECTS